MLAPQRAPVACELQQTLPHTHRLRTAHDVIRRWWPQGLLFAGSTAILADRMLAWPPSFAEDTWVYTLSGQAIDNLRHPPVSLTHTTPKPLTTLLAALVYPLPPVRAMAVVTVLCAAVLVVATFVYGWRQGGALPACAGVAALAVLPAFASSFRAEETDVISSALLVTAIVAGPRWRIAWLVLLGLVRPQAWPLAGIAGYLASERPLWRRLAAGAGCALLAPVIWLILDAIINGNPLASYHANNRINSGVPAHSLHTAVRYFTKAFRFDSGRWVLILGLAGLGVAIAQRFWRREPFLAWTVVMLPAALVFTWLHMPYNVRYTFPVTVLLPLGCAHLVSVIRLPDRLRSSSAASAVSVAVSLAALGLAAAHMPQDIYRVHIATETHKAINAAPLAGRALSCGPVGVDARPFSWFISLQLAVATRRPLTDFRYGAAMATPEDAAGTKGLILSPKANPAIDAWVREHGWHPTPIDLGTFWMSPDCHA
jgi:hypothetical protein